MNNWVYIVKNKAIFMQFLLNTQFDGHLTDCKN